MPVSHISERKLDANRRNAKLSTGPRTPEGKAKVALNALRHGLCAERPVVKELEDGSLYQRIHDQLLIEWQPGSVLEVLQLEQIAQLVWRIRRAASVETEAIENLPGKMFMGRRTTFKIPAERALVYDLSHDNPMLLRVQMYQMRLERSLRGAINDLRRLQLDRLGADEMPAREEMIEWTEIVAGNDKTRVNDEARMTNVQCGTEAGDESDQRQQPAQSVEAVEAVAQADHPTTNSSFEFRHSSFPPEKPSPQPGLGSSGDGVNMAVPPPPAAITPLLTTHPVHPRFDKTNPPVRMGTIYPEAPRFAYSRDLG